MIRSAIGNAIEHFADQLDDALPDSVRDSFGLAGASDAIHQIHAPDSLEEAEAARDRFAFEELLFIEIGVVRRRREWEERGGAPQLRLPDETRDGFVESLPFPLTGAQEKAIGAILDNIRGDVPMNRLLEGDVGSGKTVVAASALLAAVKSGHQGAIMAPTEILAEQHFRTFSAILDPRDLDSPDGGAWFQETGEGYVALRPPYLDGPVKVALLTGSQKASEKAVVHKAIASGEVDIAVGTHALVQGDVEFGRLGLVVVDEQHRFGVSQRAALREKGGSPHVLVMTATPIPRTLALTVYGDLEITVLDEMPPGRPPVKTTRVLENQRQQAWDFVRRKVDEGRQAYIICPLVEESEVIEAKAAVQEYDRLSADVFPELRMGLLHGRMTPNEKDATMRQFRDGELDILVSTAVVEVGIDVPNATVMLVEGADRFGLSQLHQFRGRVRRSSDQAYCFLLADDPTDEGKERLRIMETVNDGFELAEEDLRIRGPGEYFGTRQSGMPDLKLAKLTDVALIENTRREAGRLLDDDPMLDRPEHAELRSHVERLWGRITSEVS
jgi:ATP-dependent DNA helicase RecG